MKTHALIAILLAIFLLCGCSITDGDNAPSATLSPVSGNAAGIFFINVGKGDSILVRLHDKNYLIDTGEDFAVPMLLRSLRLCSVTALDGVFLTHTHSDHIGGLTALSQNIPVEKLFFAEISERTNSGSHKLIKLADKLGIAYTLLKAGDAVDAGNGISFDIIAPLVQSLESDNDNSLVMTLSINGRKILLTGDMQFDEEKTLLQAGTALRADILKVGNHGNPDATSQDFANAVSPEYCVISTDTSVDTDSANPEVKNRLSGASIYTTEDYDCGVMLDIESNGVVTVSNPKLPEKSANLTVTAIDKSNQTVTLKNNGSDTDISGFMLLSEKKSELFVFPEGARIDAGASVTVACYGKDGDYCWNVKKAFKDGKADSVFLYDSYGNLLSRKSA